MRGGAQCAAAQKGNLEMLKRLILVFLVGCGVSLAADFAEEKSSASVYVCPMRGKPCPMDERTAGGKCELCGMNLVTKEKYNQYLNSINANTIRVGLLLYPGFEVLDAYGPVEMWSMIPEFEIVVVAEEAGLVTSIQGLKTEAEYTFDSCPKLDILFVPGGMGTLAALKNERLLAFIRDRHAQTQITTSVCSGSALLAKAGVLDGHKATSNKKYFSLATSQSDKVMWIRSARWVDDGKVVTSSGVSAGMDMALHLIRRLFDEKKAESVARLAEYVWNKDPNNDPFATAEQ